MLERPFRISAIDLLTTVTAFLLTKACEYPNKPARASAQAGFWTGEEETLMLGLLGG